jgi:hypothetical protein
LLFSFKEVTLRNTASAFYNVNFENSSIYSFSTTSNLKLEKRSYRIRFISVVAKNLAGQALGPAEKGNHVYGCRFAPSGVLKYLWFLSKRSGKYSKGWYQILGSLEIAA